MGNRSGTPIHPGQVDQNKTTTNGDLTKKMEPLNPKRNAHGPIVKRSVSLSPWALKYMEGINLFHRLRHDYGHIEFVIPPSSPKVIIKGHKECVTEALLEIYDVLGKASNNSKGISLGLEDETNPQGTNVDPFTAVPYKVGSASTDTPIQNLNEEQLNVLPGTDVSDMPSTSKQSLNEEQLNMLPDTDVSDLPSTSKQSLSEEQLNVLPSTDVSDMSSTEIQNVGKEQLNMGNDTDGPDFTYSDEDVMDKVLLTDDSDSKDQGARADDGHVKKRISTYKDVVKSLTKTEVKQLESVVVLANLKIDQSNGIITMEGQSTHVLEAKSELETRLEEYRFSKERDRKARDLYNCVRWRYQGMVGDDCIEDYDQLTNMLLEKSYMSGDVQLHLVDEEGMKSLVVFHEMVEYIENEDQDRVKVTRTVVNPDGSTLKDNESILGDLLKPVESYCEEGPHPFPEEGPQPFPEEGPHPFPESQENTTQLRDQRNLKLEDQYIKLTMDADRALVNVLTKQEVSLLEGIQALANVKIDVANGYITLDGPLTDVKNAEGKLKTMLRHIHRKRKLDIELRTPNTIVKWCFAAGEASNDPIDYEEYINVAIEASFRNMNDGIRFFDDSRKEYVIDFVDMIEYVEPDRNVWVHVFRRVIHNNQKKVLEKTSYVR